MAPLPPRRPSRVSALNPRQDQLSPKRPATGPPTTPAPTAARFLTPRSRSPVRGGTSGRIGSPSATARRRRRPGRWATGATRCSTPPPAGTPPLDRRRGAPRAHRDGAGGRPATAGLGPPRPRGGAGRDAPAPVAVQRDRGPDRDVDAVPGSAGPAHDRLRRPRRGRVVRPADPTDDQRCRPARDAGPRPCRGPDGRRARRVVGWRPGPGGRPPWGRARPPPRVVRHDGRRPAGPRRPPRAGHPRHAAALLVPVVPRPGGTGALRPRRGPEPRDDGPPAPGPFQPGTVGPGLRVAAAGPAPLRQRPVAPPPPPADAGPDRRVGSDHPGGQRPHPGRPDPGRPPR